MATYRICSICLFTVFVWRFEFWVLIFPTPGQCLHPLIITLNIYPAAIFLIYLRGWGWGSYVIRLIYLTLACDAFLGMLICILLFSNERKSVYSIVIFHTLTLYRVYENWSFNQPFSQD